MTEYINENSVGGEPDDPIIGTGRGAFRGSEIVPKAQQLEALATSLADIVTNVRMFGAMGDGVTDDTLAFQNAINSIQSGGTLLVPSGTFLINNLIVVKDDITIKGNGILKCRSIIPTFITLTGKNIFFKCRVECDRKASKGIAISPNSEDVTIKRTKVLNCYDNGNSEVVAGIYFEGNMNDINIIECKIDGMEATEAKAENPGVSRGIWMFTFGGQTVPKNVKIKDCQIKNILPRQDGDGIHLSGFLNNTDKNNISIEKCIFDNCAKRAIKVMSSGVTIEGNTIINNFPGLNSDWSDGMSSGIAVYASNVDIINNKIYGNAYQYGIDLSPDTAYWLKNISIKDNYISPGEVGTVLPYQGVIQICTNIDGLTIDKNTITKGRYGIFFRGTVLNGNIGGNTITVSEKGIVLDSTVLSGIPTNMDFLTFDHNIIRADLYYGIQALTGGDNISFTNNILSSGYEAISTTNSKHVKSGNIGKESSGSYPAWGTALPSANSATAGQLFRKYNSGADDTLHICIKLANNSNVWKQITLV